jgi:hypothetical protein
MGIWIAVSTAFILIYVDILLARSITTVVLTITGKYILYSLSGYKISLGVAVIFEPLLNLTG